MGVCDCADEQGNDWCGPGYCKKGKCTGYNGPKNISDDDLALAIHQAARTFAAAIHQANALGLSVTATVRHVHDHNTGTSAPLILTDITRSLPRRVPVWR